MAFFVTPPIGGNRFFQYTRKKVSFFAGSESGCIRLVRNVGKSAFEIMGQAGVFPESWPF